MEAAKTNLDLQFINKDFREFCTNEKLVKEKFGDAVAEKLKARLADFQAMPDASELFELPGNPRKLGNDQDGQVAIELAEGKELILQRGHTEKRKWELTRRLKLMGIEDVN